MEDKKPDQVLLGLVRRERSRRAPGDGFRSAEHLAEVKGEGGDACRRHDQPSYEVGDAGTGTGPDTSPYATSRGKGLAQLARAAHRDRQGRTEKISRLRQHALGRPSRL
jgi:hypothetical protein